MDSADLDALTSAQLGALTTAQIRAIETADLAVFSSTDLNALGSAQFAALTTAQVDSLTTSQIANLTTEDLAALTTSQLAGFAQNADIVALTTDHFKALTTQQIAALSTAQISWLETADIVALTTAQARALTTAQIVALTTEQVVALETADIAAMTMAQSVAFSTADLAVMSAAQIDALVSVSPIVLDLNGDGVTTTNAQDGVDFDLTASGRSQKVGWVGGGDGLLVMDRNQDGAINDGRELFGAATTLASGQRAGNGYNALTELDSNHDRKIDASDGHFSDLKVWVDRNHDGKSDLSELRGLVDLGITELDLSYKSSDRMDNGNAVAMVSGYKTSDGQTHEMADVWFAKAVGDGKSVPPQLSDLLADAPTDPVPAPAAPATPSPAHPAHADQESGTPVTLRLHRSTQEEDLLRHQAPLI